MVCADGNNEPVACCCLGAGISLTCGAGVDFICLIASANALASAVLPAASAFTNAALCWSSVALIIYTYRVKHQC
jgi:hypothetical protein